MSPKRRRDSINFALVVLTLYIAVLLFVPVPFVVLSPGPTFNTIGAVDGKDVIVISGRTTYPTGGHLDLTTVSERGGPDGGVYVGRALAGWVQSDVRVLPREALFPEDIPADQVEQENTQAFVDSQSSAVTAALHYLEIPVITQVVVGAVTPGAPAEGRLLVGDVLVSIDKRVISKPADVAVAVKLRKPGDVVLVTALRDKKPVTVSIVAGSSPTNPTRAYLGISTGTNTIAPFKVDITLQDVGGPSAGTMFSLGIIDKLTPGLLNGGKYVAGTGTIDRDGTIGPIGGIAQKLSASRSAGATLFLAPVDNCADLAGNVPDGLTVAAVATIDDAVAALSAYVAGKPVPACPA